MDPQRAVLKLVGKAERAKQKARSVTELRHLQQIVETARTAARRSPVTTEVRQQIACLAIETEHALGVLIAQTKLAGGVTGTRKSRKKSGPVTAVTAPNFLRDLQIPKFVSSRAQLLAKLSPRELRRWLVDQCEQGKAPTLKAARSHAKAFAEPPARRAKTTFSGPAPASAGPLADLVEHQKMLDRLLRRLYDGGTVKFTRSEGRLVKRLVSEIVQLGRELAPPKGGDPSTHTGRN